MVARLRVEVAAGEDDLLAVGVEKGARGLADTRADAAILARLKVHDEDLIERIAAVLLLSLENDLLGIGREVALAGANKVEGELSNVLEVCAFLSLPVGAWRAATEDEGDEQGPHIGSFGERACQYPPLPLRERGWG